MTDGSVYEIKNPHHDLELAVKRAPLRYALSYPSAGINWNTGIVLYVHGYGFHFSDTYANKLRSSLADSYNCLAVSINHFGAECHQSNGNFVPAPDFFMKLREYFGLELTAPAGAHIDTILDAAFDALRQRGVTKLPADCILIKTDMEYNSFGLLPSLDCLQVLHRLLGDHPIDRRRIFLLGSSYGAYIGLLLNKIAPNTFRLIVDNSGFSSSVDAVADVYGLMGQVHRGIYVAVRSQVHFSPSPGAANYFSPAFASLRELRAQTHYRPSETVLECFHSCRDIVAPTEHKRELVSQLNDVRKCSLTIVNEADLDGYRFKTLDHGMQASLRSLFGISYDRWRLMASSAIDTTDFDLGSKICLQCDSLLYRFNFDRTNGVRLSIVRT